MADRSYHGKTVMRDAFERARLDPSTSGALVSRCLRILKTKSGTFRSRGWRVLR
jgi:hypothetical protein